jgi:4-cresol dehydrogenase (hydroxylating) flavoprotein subunit
MSSKFSVENLITSGLAHQEDLSGQKRSIRGVLSPKDRRDVVRIVKWAGQNTGTKLHPVSCGNNWGFGSHLPAEEGAYVLNLSKLNQIRELNLDAGHVEVEPGVTQGMLDATLAAHKRTHYLNVTGAGTKTSVLGNALERGIGYFGPRHKDLLDLEVLLTSGEIIRTSAIAGNPFHTCLGPDLKDLFVQSAMGIIISARIRLAKRPSSMGVVIVKPLAKTRIGELVERISILQAEGVIRTVPHIANRQRAFITFAPFIPEAAREGLRASLADWSAVVPVPGPEELLQCTFDLIASRLKDIAQCQRFSTEEPVEDRSILPLLDLAQGIPNNIALPGVAFAALGRGEPVGAQLEKGSAGLIHLGPGCPPRRARVEELIGLIHRLSSDFGELPLTVNLVNMGLAVAVISIPFDRTDQNRKRDALKLARDLAHHCQEEGFLPYRRGIGEQGTYRHSTPEFNLILEAFQSILDPKGILCRSKYRVHQRRPSIEEQLEGDQVRGSDLELVGA